MNELPWMPEQSEKAQAAVISRFMQNSVAMQFIPEHYISAIETTVKLNKYDYQKRRVIDRETIPLYELYSSVQLTDAQVRESDLSLALTTIHRATSDLARAHDQLIFDNPSAIASSDKFKSVELIYQSKKPQSLIDAAKRVEKVLNEDPIDVSEKTITSSSSTVPVNETLVKGVHDAILRLEGRGYYSNYHLVLGQELWAALHEPTAGSLVLPKDRIEPSLQGGSFYRTTTLPPEEALLVSLDGPTIDCVFAGEQGGIPLFEFVTAERPQSESGKKSTEKLYIFNIRIRFAPRVREDQSVVRLTKKP